MLKIKYTEYTDADKLYFSTITATQDSFLPFKEYVELTNIKRKDKLTIDQQAKLDAYDALDKVYDSYEESIKAVDVKPTEEQLNRIEEQKVVAEAQKKAEQDFTSKESRRVAANVKAFYAKNPQLDPSRVEERKDIKTLISKLHKLNADELQRIAQLVYGAETIHGVVNK